MQKQSVITPFCPQCKFNTSPFHAFCERCSFDLMYGTVSKTGKGNCIYCERYGKYSEEHIFGKWMVKEFGKKFKTNDHLLSRPTKNPKEENKTSIQSNARRKNENPFDQKVLNVCADCNNKWMSNLHNRSKLTVIDIANSIPINLSDLQRKNLACWIAMISINMQCYGRQLYTSQEHRTKFMKGEIPSGWRIFAGTMTNNLNSSRHVNRSLSVIYGNNGLEIIKPVVVNYFIIESAIFCSFSSSDYPVLDDLASITPGGIKVPLKEIWPNYVNIEKSAQPPINIHQANHIVEQFGQKLAEMPNFSK